ncbi:MAG: DUF1559 domain-containing protein [Armatimonadetes bacterium]|jgi:prepilin-type N-terminal cleavage/methylation domain-containing protein/prepilin-type processing-associated H-X9-DG protein|nr:DUF1559 domain-containing protein [Armatimonadota bacterium]
MPALPTTRRIASSGLTLVELLTVVAVIAVLAALLFPAFAAARETARRAACVSNLRQMAQAWLMYVQDYDDRTPGGAYTAFAGSSGAGPDGKRYTTLWALVPYLRTEALFGCPSRLGWDLSTTNPALDTHRPRRGSYSCNYDLADIPAARIDQPARLVLFCDGYNPWIDCHTGCSSCTGGCSSLIWDRIGRGCYEGDCTKPTAWHLGGIDLVFADGHATHRTLGAIEYGNWVLDLPASDAHYHQSITGDW